jgi:DNA-binding MarR family transcriptional regulator
MEMLGSDLVRRIVASRGKISSLSEEVTPSVNYKLRRSNAVYSKGGRHRLFKKRATQSSIATQSRGGSTAALPYHASRTYTNSSRQDAIRKQLGIAEGMNKQEVRRRILQAARGTGNSPQDIADALGIDPSIVAAIIDVNSGE